MSFLLEGTGNTLAAIAGLPVTAWLMIVAAGGIGLAVELVFYFRHRRRWSSKSGEGGTRT